MVIFILLSTHIPALLSSTYLDNLMLLKPFFKKMSDHRIVSSSIVIFEHQHIEKNNLLL